MQKVFFIFTEMEKVSNWCDVLSRNLQGQRIDVESVMSMKAALHFGKGFVKNSEIHLNTKFENIESVFDITQVFDTWTVWRNSECGMPEIFITIMREINVGKWWGDQVGEGKSICLRWFCSMSWWDGRRFRSSRKVERPTWRHWDVFTISRCSGNRWRSNWTRVEKFQDFSRLSILQEIQKDLIQKNIQPKEPNHLRVNVQRHPVEIRWIGIASQTLRKSTITRSSSFQDIGRFLVQAQRRHGTEVLTNNNSKKQDTLFSQTSVLRIDEFSNEDKTKVPFTSIENPRTRNSCFRRFILQLSSVSTEQRRTGVLSSTWRMKRKDQMQFLWTVKCWLLWSQKK